MPARIALSKQTSIEFYKYEGQPREDWPVWLRVFSNLEGRHMGRIATAHYDTPDGEPEWWRWFDEEKFYQQYDPT